jgi:hypothetical protein
MFDRSSDRASWSRFVAAHRGRAPRRRSSDGHDRVLIYTSDATLLRSIEHDLFGERLTSHVVRSLTDVITNLTLVPPPWPQYLIVDAAAISPADAPLLGAIREAGWRGVVIAIGDPSAETCHSLGIDVVLPRSFGTEVLRNSLKHAAMAQQTARDDQRKAG